MKNSQTLFNDLDGSGLTTDNKTGYMSQVMVNGMSGANNGWINIKNNDGSLSIIGKSNVPYLSMANAKYAMLNATIFSIPGTNHYQNSWTSYIDWSQFNTNPDELEKPSTIANNFGDSNRGVSIKVLSGTPDFYGLPQTDAHASAAVSQAKAALDQANTDLTKANQALTNAKNAAATADAKVTDANNSLTAAKQNLAKAQSALTQANQALSTAKAHKTTTADALTKANQALDAAKANVQAKTKANDEAQAALKTATANDAAAHEKAAQTAAALKQSTQSTDRYNMLLAVERAQEAVATKKNGYHADHGHVVDNAGQIVPGWSVNAAGDLVDPDGAVIVKAAPKTAPKTAVNSSVANATAEPMSIMTLYHGRNSSQNSNKSLPQTGDASESSAIALGVAALTSMLGLTVFGKKRV